MAKLKAPLLSLGASGKLGDALVFFNWKGIDVVREYVVPTNPDTPLQRVQRGYLRDAVTTIHRAQARVTYAIDRDDTIAYAAKAAALGKTMTWFNMACKLWLDTKRAVKIPAIYSGGELLDTDKGDFRPRIWLNEEVATSIVNAHFWLGPTRTSLIHSKIATMVVGISASLNALAGFSGLTAGDKYYWQFRPDAADAGAGAESGIYYGYAT